MFGFEFKREIAVNVLQLRHGRLAELAYGRRTRVNRTVFVFALVIVLGAGAWAYVYGVLDPNRKAQRRDSDGVAYRSDLYERWLGTRLVLRDHANPYDPSVTKEIQKGIYGHPLEGPSGWYGFAYPAHVILLVAPLAVLPFSTAAGIFSFVLVAMAMAVMPLFMSCLGQTWNRKSKTLAIVILFASFPLALAIYAQQLTLFVIFVLAAGLACLNKRRPILAGILFALSTIKPQLTVLILGWLAVWSMTRWRSRYPLMISFLVSETILLVTPEFLVSGWITKWLAAANSYLQYPSAKFPGAWLLPGILAPLATAAALFPALVLLWRLRDADPGHERFAFAIALALAATLLLVPTWPALQYNDLLLIPAVLVIANDWNDRLSRRQRQLATLALATLGFSSIAALFVSAVVLIFRIYVDRLGHWVELPFFNFALVPFMVTIVMAGILWSRARARELYAGSQN